MATEFPSSQENEAVPSQVRGRHAHPSCLPSDERELRVLDLLQALRRRWKRVFLVTALGTTATLSYALLATPMFRARAVISPPAERESRGGASVLAAFGGIGTQIAGSLGISPGAVDANRLEALLASHRLLRRVIDRYDLLPILFHDEWNPKEKRWLADDPEDIPDIWDAARKLEDLYRIKNDPKKGVIEVSFEAETTSTALIVLQYFLKELALLMQEIEVSKIDTNHKFIQDQLEKINDPALVSKLQVLLSDQVERAMMAQNSENFAFELIDPPAASNKKVRPKRAMLVILGFTFSSILGACLALIAEGTRVSAQGPNRERADFETADE